MVIASGRSTRQVASMVRTRWKDTG
jgi:ribosomal silencing factor RsfS